MANKKYEHEITVKIEGKDWTDALDKAFAEKSKDVTVSGFRKGKVPRDIYEKKFGKESLFLSAGDKVIGIAYEKAIEESKLVPAVQPRLDITAVDESGITFKFLITTKPEVKVKKYKGLKIKKEEATVTQEEIDHEIGHIMEKYTEYGIKEKGTVANGDIAVIDFEGFKDGVPFEGGKAENYELGIGSGSFIPGFEEQLIGLKAGEEKDIKVTFPEEYGEASLAGKEVVFKIKIHEIKEKIERELDEEFFEDLDMEGVDSKEKLSDSIKADLLARKEMDTENKYIDQLLEAVSKNVEVDIPEAMVEEEVSRLLERYEEQLKTQGITLDLYYQFTGTKEEDLKKQMEREAYNHVLYRLMLEEISQLEKISISDEEVEKEATELAKKYKMEKAEFMKMFGGVNMVKYDMEMRKIIEILKEANK